MSKIVLIGIDGLDPLLLNRWKKHLPHFGALFKDGSEIVTESTFPPDSICAWTSIFAGENPVEHGLIESIDYLSGKKMSDDRARSGNFKGRTFWDIAGIHGKSVCVINHFMAYPAWEVNGVMVSGPVFEGGDISAYPETVSREYDFPPLGGIVEFPDEKGLGEFLVNTKKSTKQLADVSFKMYKDYKPDLFFVTFLTLDRVKHFLWRFTDKDDMYYPGVNPYEEAIKEFYVLFDTIIGNYREALADDTTLIVISDHGHRRRCSKCLNLNELLRIKGYIELSGGGALAVLKKVVEKAKVTTISFLSRMELQDWIYKIAKFVPNRKALKKSTYLIDKSSSAVTLSNLCGTNPFGGLNIRASTGEEYERLREKIIKDLLTFRSPDGAKVVKWASKRESVYSGQYIQRLPDILFELDDEYGVGMDLYTPLITENYTHRKISGGHKKEAVLLVYSHNANIHMIKRPKSVMGLKDYILNILNI